VPTTATKGGKGAKAGTTKTTVGVKVSPVAGAADPKGPQLPTTGWFTITSDGAWGAAVTPVVDATGKKLPLVTSLVASSKHKVGQAGTWTLTRHALRFDCGNILAATPGRQPGSQQQAWA
jgi:hypothetical protein